MRMPHLHWLIVKQTPLNICFWLGGSVHFVGMFVEYGVARLENGAHNAMSHNSTFSIIYRTSYYACDAFLHHLIVSE
jgi:hypothetical protein